MSINSLGAVGYNSYATSFQANPNKRKDFKPGLIPPKEVQEKNNKKKKTLLAALGLTVGAAAIWFFTKGKGKEYLNGALKQLEPYINSAKDKVKPYIETVKGAVKPYIDGAKNKIKPYVEAVKGKIKPYIEGAKNKVKPYVETVKNTVNEVNPHIETVAPSVEFGPGSKLAEKAISTQKQIEITKAWRQFDQMKAAAMPKVPQAPKIPTAEEIWTMYEKGMFKA